MLFKLILFVTTYVQISSQIHKLVYALRDGLTYRLTYIFPKFAHTFSNSIATVIAQKLMTTTLANFRYYLLLLLQLTCCTVISVVLVLFSGIPSSILPALRYVILLSVHSWSPEKVWADLCSLRPRSGLVEGKFQRRGSVNQRAHVAFCKLTSTTPLSHFIWDFKRSPKHFLH